MRTPYPRRLAALRTAMVEAKAQAFLTLHSPNLYYLCGFTGSNGALLVTQSKLAFFTDGRYIAQSRDEVRGARIHIVQGGGLLAAVGNALREAGRLRLAIEAEHVTVAQKRLLGRKAGRQVRLQASAGLVETLRTVKDGDELARIRQAARLGSSMFEQMLPLLRPGVRENEIAAELEYRMRRAGASGVAFETIVAFGERSALPHARPTTRKLRRNELVVLDWGAILHRYCCDLTRTVFVGKAPKRVRDWYSAVSQAQREARDVVRAGVTGQEVDAAARSVLERQGLAKHFTHSLGHGFGLEVHEEPRLAQGQKRRLQPGQVITIEPGVYVEGVGGIRIEDDVVVTPRGAEVLTTATRDFLEL